MESKVRHISPSNLKTKNSRSFLSFVPFFDIVKKGLRKNSRSYPIQLALASELLRIRSSKQILQQNCLRFDVIVENTGLDAVKILPMLNQIYNIESQGNVYKQHKEQNKQQFLLNFNRITPNLQQPTIQNGSCNHRLTQSPHQTGNLTAYRLHYHSPRRPRRRLHRPLHLHILVLPPAESTASSSET
ncbi:hypothetical protein DL98DRAFT_602251 [Cadophora sp. DSE1049]|nr:hypothetical protein DL98DRAFT_602251 [Cadophora sp. DSE1049]